MSKRLWLPGTVGHARGDIVSVSLSPYLLSLARPSVAFSLCECVPGTHFSHLPRRKSPMGAFEPFSRLSVCASDGSDQARSKPYSPLAVAPLPPLPPNADARGGGDQHGRREGGGYQDVHGGHPRQALPGRVPQGILQIVCDGRVCLLGVLAFHAFTWRQSICAWPQARRTRKVSKQKMFGGSGHAEPPIDKGKRVLRPASGLSRDLGPVGPPRTSFPVAVSERYPGRCLPDLGPRHCFTAAVVVDIVEVCDAVVCAALDHPAADDVGSAVAVGAVAETDANVDVSPLSWLALLRIDDRELLHSRKEWLLRWCHLPPRHQGLHDSDGKLKFQLGHAKSLPGINISVEDRASSFDSILIFLAINDIEIAG